MGMVEELKAAIAASGLSHYELANRSGVNASTISRFARGIRTVNMATASKLATALQMRLDHVERTQQ